MVQKYRKYLFIELATADNKYNSILNRKSK